MVRRKSLGRGLDALLSHGGTGVAKRPATDAEDRDISTLPVDILQRGAMQPRQDMRTDSLEDLANSIRQQGILQPIVVREISKGRYEIVAGERRWRAAQMAGLQDVPVIVRNVSDQDAAAIAIIENIQRANLNPMEQAYGLERLKDQHDMTHQSVADAVGKSRTAVSNLLRLLELEDEVKKMVNERRLEMGHARALLGLAGRKQIQAAKDVAARELSVRATERLVRQLAAPPKAKAKTPSQDPDVLRLQDRLSEILGARVSVVPGRGGQGKLTITYNSLDELDGIIEHIK